jgi:crotonobetainyl-CoA:carnitine CoA-transferase CaiB-like acyl-CoA transferase
MFRVTGADPVLPGRFLVGTAAAECVGSTTSAAAELFRDRGGEPGEVAVDVRHAAHAFRSERYLRLNGEPVGDLWASVSGDYAGADGWIRIHANFPHHAAAAARALGVPEDHDAFAAAIRTRPVRELEDAVHAAGGVAAAMRTAEEWAAHPAGDAVRGIPLVGVEPIAPAPPRALPPGPRPLSGVRVLDLTHVIAGPLCGRTLAAHGAAVIHVGAAHLPILRPLQLDHGFDKRDVFLDLRTESGRKSLRDLIADAHIVVSSYRPGALAALGFGPADLAELRPGIVSVELSAWGHAGPWAARRGFDSLVQMSSGIAAEPLGTKPTSLPAQVLDHATGWLAAGAAINGLRRQTAEGGSWRIRLALARTAAWFTDLGRLPADVAISDLPKMEDPKIESPISDVPKMEDPISEYPVSERPIPADLMSGLDSYAGKLRYIRIPGDLPGAPPGWRHGARQPGSDRPTWD